MAVLEIPLTELVPQGREFTVSLDEVSYNFKISYNQRMDSWVLGIDDVISGIRISKGVDILKQFHHLDLPPGELKVIDLDMLNREPDLSNFGDRVRLVYIEDGTV